MEDALERARTLLALFDEELRREIPPDAELFDAHVHVGRDIDGFVAPYDELVSFLERYGVKRAFAFCMDEPDREPAFRAANDRTLAAAERSDGMIIPFVRLDLSCEPVEEAQRCLDRGARGIKLHPRAQRFLLNDDRLAPIFELAAERRVPILIHGGRGLPPIADHLERLVDANAGAQLIIAHAGIADLAALSEAFGGRAGVFFDTSVWSPIDLLDFYARVSPEQILYASDFPYGQQPGSLLIAIRTARTAGFDDDHIRAMLGLSAARIADGKQPVEPSKPKGSLMLEQPLTLARIHHYLAMATPLLWTRQLDTIGVLGLALNACHERDGYMETRTMIADLLLTARELWRTLPEAEEAERVELSRYTFRLIHLADILTMTAHAELTVNGSSHELDVTPERTLAEALREDIGLTGTKIACGEGHCGACTVILDGKAVLSCITLVHTVGEREVTTIEGLREHPLVEAFVRADALQCGFCTPGQIASAAALVAESPDPTPEDVRHRMSGNLCRCGAYPKIEEAIRTWRA